MTITKEFLTNKIAELQNDWAVSRATMEKAAGAIEAMNYMLNILNSAQELPPEMAKLAKAIDNKTKKTKKKA